MTIKHAVARVRLVSITAAVIGLAISLVLSHAWIMHRAYHTDGLFYIGANSEQWHAVVMTAVIWTVMFSLAWVIASYRERRIQMHLERFSNPQEAVASLLMLIGLGLFFSTITVRQLYTEGIIWPLLFIWPTSGLLMSYITVEPGLVLCFLSSLVITPIIITALISPYLIASQLSA